MSFFYHELHRGRSRHFKKFDVIGGVLPGEELVISSREQIVSPGECLWVYLRPMAWKDEFPLSMLGCTEKVGFIKE